MIFSVVVPTHNRPETLQRLMASLAAQQIDLTSFEIIVVPSPNDRGLKWLMEYAKTSPTPLVIHVPSPDPYQGRSASFKRNEGVKRAQGEWIAFIDDDCIADRLWLGAAALHTQKRDLHGIEGRVEIPPPPEPTLTYKGLQRLSAPGGYQTCNMFYRRSTFLELGGFDLNLPFYLEDTDLAWTFLDHRKSILFLPEAIVQHPVPPAEVRRLLDNAKRTRLIPYLYKKHPDEFSHSDFRPLSASQWTYLVFYFGILYSTAVSAHKLHTFILLTAVALIYHMLNIYRLLNGCKFSGRELWELFIYLPAAPVIAFVQLMRGNIENKTFLFF